MAKRFLVVGLGRLGQACAEALAQAGAEVVAVDVDMHMVSQVKDRVSFAAQLDATDPAALAEVDARTCQAAVVTFGHDFEATVLCVAALKEAGVAEVIARAASSRQTRILTAVGATRVFDAEEEFGRRLGQGLAGG
jgi:trk system potassium uptake protein TrkA